MCGYPNEIQIWVDVPLTTISDVFKWFLAQ